MEFTIGFPFKKWRGLTQLFGENKLDYSQLGMIGHNGLDIGCDNAEPVLSICDGKVVYADKKDKGYGINIFIETDKRLEEDGFVYLYEIVYGHLKDINVEVDQIVKKGQIVARADNSGWSTGTHLHFGVRPYKYLSQNARTLVFDNNGYKGYIDPYPLFEELITPLTYDIWKKLNKKIIQKFEIIPVNNRYGQTRNWSSYLKEKAMVVYWTSRLKRLPTMQEINGSIYGHWDKDVLFKNKLADFWKYYTKDRYNLLF